MIFEKLVFTTRRLTKKLSRASAHPKMSSAAVLVAILLALQFNTANAQNNCGPIANPFGPFDYRIERGNSLYLVESTHFVPIVEALISGSTGVIGSDIDYTLRAFPNHHRALVAMVRLGEKEKTTQPRGARYTVDCWFDRALRFKPDDTTVRLIYSGYLAKNSRLEDALAQLKTTTRLAKDNAFTHYNIGLVYFDLKRYDESLLEAHIAYGLGFQQPGLRNQLEAVGKWKDPEPTSSPVQDAARDAVATETPLPAADVTSDPATQK